MQTVSIASPEMLDATISGYLAKGFVISDRKDEIATLQKHKKFNIASLLLLFIPILGWALLVIYVIIFAMKPSAEVLTIKVKAATQTFPTSHHPSSSGKNHV